MAGRSSYNRFTKKQLADEISKQLTKSELVAILKGNDRKKGRVVARSVSPPPMRSGKGLDDQLLDAAGHGRKEIVKALIKRGADVNTSDLDFGTNDIGTALMWAVDGGHKETAQILIDAGAEVNAIGRNEQTALMLAADRRYVDIMKMLIEAGADPTMKDGSELTARDYYRGSKKEFDRIVRQYTPEEMIMAARTSPARSPPRSPRSR